MTAEPYVPACRTPDVTAITPAAGGASNTLSRRHVLRAVGLAMPALLGLARPAPAQSPAAQSPAAPGPAVPLPQPAGNVLLTVGGQIGRTNAPGLARFDDAMLAALPQRGFATSTVWTQTRDHFSGPPLRRVLEAAGAEPVRIYARAANDYQIDVVLDEVDPDLPIIARQINGLELPRRARGPLWIMFPFDSAARFRRETVYAQAVWHLIGLDLRSG